MPRKRETSGTTMLPRRRHSTSHVDDDDIVEMMASIEDYANRADCKRTLRTHDRLALFCKQRLAAHEDWRAQKYLRESGTLKRNESAGPVDGQSPPERRKPIVIAKFLSFDAG